MFKTVTSLSALLMLLAGCSSAGPTHGEVTGSAAFRLIAMGHTPYRLASAELEINGPESVLLTTGEGEATVFVELVVGTYGSRLLDTWRVQRNIGRAWEDVDARLEDDAEKPFSIAAGELTEISYRFTVDNDALPPPCLSCPSRRRDTAAIRGAAADRTAPVTPALEDPPVATDRLDRPGPAPVR